MKYSLFFAATAAAYDAYGGYGVQQSSSVPAKVSSAPSYDNYGGYGGQSSSAPSKPSSSAPVYGDYPVTSVKTSAPASKATPCSTVVGSNGYTTIVPGYGKPPVTVTQQHQSYPTCAVKAYDGKSCDKWEDDKYVSTVITDYNKKIVTITKIQDYVTVYQEKKTITHSATPTAGGYGAVSTPIAKNSTGVWYELYEKVILCKYAECGKNILVGYTGSGLCQKCDDEQPVTQKEYKGGKWTEEKKTLNYGKPKDEVKVYEKPGVYTVPAKVVTVYKSEATGSGKPSYEAGIYHIPAKVITITKSNQPYTCTYELSKQTPSKSPSKGDDKPVTKTPTYNDYGYKASATPTPKKPSNDYPSYPKTNSTSAYKPSSTPCDEDKKKSTATPLTISKPVHGGDNGYATPTPTPCYGDNCPCYGDNCKKSSSAPSKPSSTPAVYYSDNSNPSSTAPSKPSSTPCDDDKKKATPTPYNNGGNNYDNGAKPTPTPYNNGNGGNYGDAAKPTPTPVYNNGNGDASKPTPTPVAPVYPADPSGGYSSNTEYGKTNTGYTKRGGMIERRKAAVEAQKKRELVL